MSPTTELEENLKLCNLKEQQKAKDSLVAAMAWLWDPWEDLLPSKATERNMAADIPAHLSPTVDAPALHVGHNKDTSLP